MRAALSNNLGAKMACHFPGFGDPQKGGAYVCLL